MAGCSCRFLCLADTPYPTPPYPTVTYSTCRAFEVTPGQIQEDSLWHHQGKQAGTGFCTPEDLLADNIMSIVRRFDRGCRSSFSSCDPPPKKNLLLDVIGSHRELTVIGHVNVIKFLPFVRQHNLLLLEQYYCQPGNYAGRPGQCANTTAKVIDYGNDYLALKLYDDLTRPELGEFLLNRGWDMIGYATSKHQDSIFVMEKWCSKDDCDKC